MSNITIQGVSYNGNNITIINGKVMIGDTDVTPIEKEISIVVNGNIQSLNVDSCKKLTVTGDITNFGSTSGDAEITGNVLGSVNTVSGSVYCANVSGNISTVSGKITHKTI